MPSAPPTTYATLSNPLTSSPYILSITPSPSGHLLLRHPSSEITIADPQTLQPIDRLQGGHTGNVSDIVVDQDQGAVWSGAKDGVVVRWDERSRSSATSLKAIVRRLVPVTALAVSESDHLIIVGTEVVSSEAHILFYDTRNPKTPAYTHSSTHSDDITHLSLLPPTSTFLPSSSSNPTPPRLLLSASTDGLVALSDMRETDEDEAVQCAENWGQSIATAGYYATTAKGQSGSGMKVWARSDMDGVAVWTIGRGEEDALELGNVVEFPSEEFKFRSYDLPVTGPSVVGPTGGSRRDKLQSDYLVDVVPSLGISKTGAPMTVVGTNEGDMVVQHHYPASATAASGSVAAYRPSAFFLTGRDTESGQRGHKDVVRALYHDVRNEAVYTGSEDGVLAGWSLASMERLRVGDPDVDDDGGDGRDQADDEEEDEESEIESESDEMDVDDDDEDGLGGREEGPRNGPILGRGADRLEKRKGNRHQPY